RPPATAIEGAREPGAVAVLATRADRQRRTQRRYHVRAAAAGAVSARAAAETVRHAGAHAAPPWMRPPCPGRSRVPRGSRGGTSRCCRSANAGARRLASELNLDIGPTWVARPP